MIILIAGLILFIATHSIRLAVPGWRENMIAALGETPWRVIYSITSTLAFVLLVWGYAAARENTFAIYDPPEWGRHVALTGMFFASILATAFFFPSAYMKTRLGNPFMVATIIWGAVHLLANGDAASVLLFGCMLLWAFWYYFAARRRQLDDFIPVSSNIKQDLIAIAVGAGLYILIVFVAHSWLIGVSPI